LSAKGKKIQGILGMVKKYVIKSILQVLYVNIYRMCMASFI